MNDSERLQLQKMIQANDAEDNTSLIRTLKHSKLIWQDVNIILNFKKNYAELEKTNLEEFCNLCSSHAHFLFSTYTDIFNKVIKNEINLDILLQLINVLKAIEEGACDQHEGSFAVGKILKELYVDSALRKNKNQELQKQQDEIPKENIVEISWKEYKSNNLNV